MNADHFSLLEKIDLEFTPENEQESGDTRKDLCETLLEEFSALPSQGKELDLANYAIINVAPSVVPNPYLPSFRIFTYNVTGKADVEVEKRKKGSKRRHGHRRGDHGDKATYCRKEKYRDSWKCHLNETMAF